MKNYQTLFSRLDKKAPNGLFEQVIFSIEKEEIRVSKRNMTYGIVASVTSFLALIPAGYFFVINIMQSSFGSYLSLIFSDGWAVTTYWKEFLLSLIESFSVTEYLAVLVCLFALFASLRFVAQNRVNSAPSVLQFN